VFAREHGRATLGHPGGLRQGKKVPQIVCGERAFGEVEQ
jgi:hypothetical protein